MSFRTYRLERPPSAYNSEQLAEQLARRARWSVIVGLASMFLYLLAWFQLSFLPSLPPALGVVSDIFDAYSGLRVLACALGAILGGLAAIGIAMVGVKWENTNNRTLGFVGIFLGILASASTFCIGLFSVPVLAMFVLVAALPVILLIVFAVYLFALP